MIDLQEPYELHIYIYVIDAHTLHSHKVHFSVKTSAASNLHQISGDPSAVYQRVARCREETPVLPHPGGPHQRPSVGLAVPCLAAWPCSIHTAPQLAGAESGLHCLLCADALEGSDGGDQERKPSGRGAQRQSISCKGEKANM